MTSAPAPLRRAKAALFALAFAAAPLSAQEEPAGSSLSIKPKNPSISLDSAAEDSLGGSIEDSLRTKHQSLSAKLWYLKAATTVSYFNLGPDIDRLFTKINGSFNGNRLSPDILVYKTSFTLKTDDPVERPATNFIPTGDLGLGMIFEKHQVELTIGLAGLVPLNTINSQTKMTMQEGTVCNGVRVERCQLAGLGMVSPATGKGRYDMDIVMNEDVWLVTPAVNYDFIFLTKPLGRMSAGGSMGLMLMSMRQEVRFKGKRLDSPKVGDLSDDYRSRTMEGVAVASTIGQAGPIARLFVSLRRALVPGITGEFRAGVNYGWVDMTMDIDGAGTAYIGNKIAATFPLSALGFKNREENRLEMMGFFVQMGLIF